VLILSLAVFIALPAWIRWPAMDTFFLAVAEIVNAPHDPAPPTARPAVALSAAVIFVLVIHLMVHLWLI
jgi:hypothetical protein